MQDATAPTPSADADYLLSDQIGFILRQVMQRHVSLFAQAMGEELTPTQWAVLSYLFQNEGCSQNLLGRQTAMDVATVKGVVDRLRKRKLVETTPDPGDARRLIVNLTEAGRALTLEFLPKARIVTEQTLLPLDKKDRAVLADLLKALR